MATPESVRIAVVSRPCIRAAIDLVSKKPGRRRLTRTHRGGAVLFRANTLQSRFVIISASIDGHHLNDGIVGMRVGYRSNMAGEEVTLAQDHVVVLASAREELRARCYVAAERIAGGWRPQSSLDVDILVQVGEAIAVLDRLIREEAAADRVKAAVAPAFVDALSRDAADLVGA